MRDRAEIAQRGLRGDSRGERFADEAADGDQLAAVHSGGGKLQDEVSESVSPHADQGPGAQAARATSSAAVRTAASTRTGPCREVLPRRTPPHARATGNSGPSGETPRLADGAEVVQRERAKRRRPTSRSTNEHE